MTMAIRETPCPATNVRVRVTRHSGVEKVVGPEAAAHFVSKERLGHSGFMATAKRKAARSWLGPAAALDLLHGGACPANPAGPSVLSVNVTCLTFRRFPLPSPC